MLLDGPDDSDFRVVRKTMNAFSVLIAILAFTNAEISSLNFLGIAMALNGAKFYIALFIGYSYFIWRYFTKVPFADGFWQSFLDFYFTSGSGVKKQHSYERYRDCFLHGEAELRRALENHEPGHLIEMQVVRPAGRSIRNPRLSALYYLPGEDGGKNVTANHDIKVSWWFVIGKLLIFSLRYDKFGDYIFPILLVVLNACFFLLLGDWQGSIRSLLLE